MYKISNPYVFIGFIFQFWLLFSATFMQSRCYYIKNNDFKPTGKASKNTPLPLAIPKALNC